MVTGQSTGKTGLPKPIRNYKEVAYGTRVEEYGPYTAAAITSTYNMQMGT